MLVLLILWPVCQTENDLNLISPVSRQATHNLSSQTYFYYENRISTSNQLGSLSFLNKKDDVKYHSCTHVNQWIIFEPFDLHEPSKQTDLPEWIKLIKATFERNDRKEALIISILGHLSYKATYKQLRSCYYKSYSILK